MLRLLLVIVTVLGVFCGDTPSVASAATAARMRLKEIINERKNLLYKVQDDRYPSHPKHRAVCVLHTQFPYLRVAIECPGSE